MRIDVLLLAAGPTGGAPAWSLGSIIQAEPTVTSVARAVAAIATSGEDAPDAVLHWSSEQGQPDPDLVLGLLDQPDDVWHAGLRLGLAGLPRTIDHVAPTWMLNRDADPGIEATSWRLSLAACLVRTRVIADMGHVDQGFASLDAAALELGHRWISHGARLRHVPDMIEGRAAANPRPPTLSLADGLRFVDRRYGRKWMAWSAVAEARRPLQALAAARQATRPSAMPAPPTNLRPEPLDAATAGDPALGTVTVLLPTVERYPSLDTVLSHLRTQTVAPAQVVIVDQTPLPARRTDLTETFADLPIEVLHLDEAGQSTARNAGLAHATGDHVLFIDDDDELPDDLIALHLQALAQRRVEVSSGVVHEPNGPPLSAEFQRFRASDTFPTNNSMVRRSALDRSGWFDPAYDRGDRADHDLGMRLYLAGARMVMDPRIDLIHNHAPRGGLRVHNARAVTYGKARATVRLRQQLSPTQIYLWRRYYTPEQVRSGIRLHLAAGLFGTGPRSRRLARLAVQLLSLPSARREAQAADRAAGELLAAAAPIPHVPGAVRP